MTLVVKYFDWHVLWIFLFWYQIELMCYLAHENPVFTYVYHIGKHVKPWFLYYCSWDYVWQNKLQSCGLRLSVSFGLMEFVWYLSIPILIILYTIDGLPSKDVAKDLIVVLSFSVTSINSSSPLIANFLLQLPAFLLATLISSPFKFLLFSYSPQSEQCCSTNCIL